MPCSYPPKQRYAVIAERQPTSKKVLYILLAIVAVLWWFTNNSHPPSSASPSGSGTAASGDKEYVLSRVDISKFSWRKDGFGNVMEADFAITNKSNHDVKDCTIECTHSAPSGTVIDSNKRTIYEVIKAGKTRSFRNFNMGFIHSQARRSGCKITDLTLACRLSTLLTPSAQIELTPSGIHNSALRSAHRIQRHRFSHPAMTAAAITRPLLSACP